MPQALLPGLLLALPLAENFVSLGLQAADVIPDQGPLGTMGAILGTALGGAGNIASGAGSALSSGAGAVGRGASLGNYGSQLAQSGLDFAGELGGGIGGLGEALAELSGAPSILGGFGTQLGQRGIDFSNSLGLSSAVDNIAALPGSPSVGAGDMFGGLKDSISRTGTSANMPTSKGIDLFSGAKENMYTPPNPSASSSAATNNVPQTTGYPLLDKLIALKQASAKQDMIKSLIGKGVSTMGTVLGGALMQPGEPDQAEWKSPRNAPWNKPGSTLDRIRRRRLSKKTRRMY